MPTMGMAASGEKTITINVQGKNNPPTVPGCMGLTVLKRRFGRLADFDFERWIPRNRPTLLFSLSADLPNARPSGLLNDLATQITTFTEAQLEAGQVYFVHDRSANNRGDVHGYSLRRHCDQRPRHDHQLYADRNDRRANSERRGF